MPIKPLIISLFFILFDIISGLIAALKNGEFKSAIMREGLFNKIGEILSLCFAYGCEFALPYIGVTVSIPLCKGIMIYIVFMEIGSIVENLSKISPTLSLFLHKTFEQYKNKNEETEVGKHEKH